MPTINSSINISGLNSRKTIRDHVITTFLLEVPGTGKGVNCSRYIYYVETLANGSQVYLSRPAWFNKGVDFTVNVQNLRFRPSRMVEAPSHANILDDLSDKKASNPTAYGTVSRIINDLYLCQPVSDRTMRSLVFGVGHPVEAILKAVKWLFIEQDVTYWNWSGRQMLFDGLRDRQLC